MVQDSIVDYINSQMKLGVSRDAIKTTLTGAGWVPADVEDTLKKVELSKPAQPAAAMPAAMPGMPTGMLSMPTAGAAKPATPASGMGTPSGANPAPQVMKISDLISSSAPMAAKPTTPATPAAQGPKSPLTGPTLSPVATPAGTKTGNTFQAASFSAAKPHASRAALIVEIVLGVVIAALAAFAGFLFMQNNSLNSQLTTLNGQSSSVNSQLSALQTQVTASTTALTAQIATLGAANQELQTELSFLAAPTSSVSGATSNATVNGTVSAGKASYVITGTYGAKIFVANSKSAAVIAALNPLLATAGTPASTSTTGTSTPATAGASATPAQFSGTYIPGSDSITLTSVNGAAVQ